MKEVERKMRENPALQEIAEKLPNIPPTPGCYLWLGDPNENRGSIQGDGNSRVLYIGKSVNLRSRVRQYLHSEDYKTRFLMNRVRDIEWVTTDNELEALLLENTLIKRHKPPYNVHLKDDKRYPYLCLTMGEPFPRLVLTRRKFSREHLYFGPYSDVRAARNTMELIHKVFPLRKRPLKLPLKNPARPCLNFHIKRCWAPCTGTVNQEEYRELVLQVRDFLEGRDQEVEKMLTTKMNEYAQAMEFEKAARYRDILRDIELLRQSQEVESAGSEDDFDVIGIFAIEREKLARALDTDEIYLDYFTDDSAPILGQLALLRIRGGKVTAKRSYAFSEAGGWDSTSETEFTAEFMESFLRDYYLAFKDVPPEILISHPLRNTANWEKLLSQVAGHAVSLVALGDRYEEKKKLLRMAETNARLTLRERILNEKTRNQKIGLRQIQKFLGLKDIPHTIECYDISNIQGSEPVAAGVMLKEGLPHKSGYRKYAIKTVEGANDPAMMYEVIDRRMRRIAEGGAKAPDLVVIDGGITQLRAAIRARDIYGFKIPMIGLAKQREEIHTEEGRLLRFDPNSPGMLILRLARDEAHRFGVAYHRNRRMKRNLRSLLDGIEGVGEIRRKQLMNVLRKISLDDYTVQSLVQKIQQETDLPSDLARQVADTVYSL